MVHVDGRRAVIRRASENVTEVGWKCHTLKYHLFPTLSIFLEYGGPGFDILRFDIFYECRYFNCIHWGYTALEDLKITRVNFSIETPDNVAKARTANRAVSAARMELLDAYAHTGIFPVIGCFEFEASDGKKYRMVLEPKIEELA